MTSFADHLYGQGKARRTVDEYDKWVRRAARWCCQHGVELDTVEGHQLRAWSETIPESWASRKQARTALCHWCRWVGRDETLADAIRVPRKPAGRPRPLTADRAGTLRDTAIMVGGRRGLATLACLYTAARPSEVAGLRWDGIDADEATIRWWRTKMSDWHTVPLHPVLTAALDRARPRVVEGHIFAGNNGRAHVSPTTVWSWVREVAEVADMAGVTPQRLRATAGSAALEATGDIDAVAELLGHRDPATTRQYYVVTSQRRLRAAVDALDY